METRYFKSKVYLYVMAAFAGIGVILRLWAYDIKTLTLFDEYYPLFYTIVSIYGLALIITLSFTLLKEDASLMLVPYALLFGLCMLNDLGILPALFAGTVPRAVRPHFIWSFLACAVCYTVLCLVTLGKIRKSFLTAITVICMLPTIIYLFRLNAQIPFTLKQFGQGFFSRLCDYLVILVFSLGLKEKEKLLSLKEEERVLTPSARHAALTSLGDESPIGASIVAGLLSLGAYTLVWQCLASRRLRLLNNEPEEGMSVEMFLIVLIPFYNLYWLYHQGQKLSEASRKSHIKLPDHSLVYLLLGLFGFGLVALIILQSQLNTLAKAWSRMPWPLSAPSSYDPACSSPIDLLRELSLLRDEHILTEEEFAQKKLEILSKI